MYYDHITKSQEIGEVNTLTKSYEDGIMDALRVIESWKYVGIVSSAIYTIESQLIKLLPPGYIINSTDIVDPDNTRQ